MAIFSRPGVFISEATLPNVITTADNGTAVGALIGTLERGPIVPTLVTSWSQFVKNFGNNNVKFPTTFAAYSFFANGGRNLYVQRLTKGVAATNTLKDSFNANTLTVSAANPGTWGNGLSVEAKAGVNGRFSLLVYGPPTTASATSNLLEQYADLSMDSANPRYAVTVINTLSQNIKVVDDLAGTNPVAGGLKALSAGTEGAAILTTDYDAAFVLFDTITAPLVFNLPDVPYIYATDSVSANAITVALIDYCEAKISGFAVVDVPAGLSAANALTYATTIGTGAGTNSAIYGPWMYIADPISSTPGATRLIPVGAAVVGQYLTTDATRGVFKAPAGLGNRLGLAVALEKLYTNTELDSLNSATTPINAIRVLPGAGIVVMGARTMSDNTGDRYINVRRSLIHIKRQVEDMTQFAIFENNDAALRSKIRTVLTTFLSGYWSQGGLRGSSASQAFYIVCDNTNNTEADMLNGRVNIEIGVSVEYPAEFVVITIGQITGTATVTG
jgi:phage tail sheath protein FI